LARPCSGGAHFLLLRAKRRRLACLPHYSPSHALCAASQPSRNTIFRTGRLSSAFPANPPQPSWRIGSGGTWWLAHAAASRLALLGMPLAHHRDRGRAALIRGREKGHGTALAGHDNEGASRQHKRPLRRAWKTPRNRCGRGRRRVWRAHLRGDDVRDGTGRCRHRARTRQPSARRSLVVSSGKVALIPRAGNSKAT
jgi:hypothetical protein